MSNLPINWFPRAAVRKPAAQTIDEGYTRGTPIEPEEYQYIIRNLSSALIALTGEAQGAERQVVIPAGGLAWRQGEPVYGVRVAAKIADGTRHIADIRTWASPGLADAPGTPLDPDEVDFWQGESPWTTIFASTQLPRATFGGQLTEARLVGNSNGFLLAPAYAELVLIDGEGTSITGRCKASESNPGVSGFDTFDPVFRFNGGPNDGDPIEGELVGHVDLYLRINMTGETPWNDEQTMLKFSGIRLTFAAETSA